MKQQEIIIREATVADAETLCEIYAYYVEHTAITFETQAPSVAEFTERICAIQEWYPYFVAECQGKILGYAYAGVFKNRAAYDWAVETTIYVREDQRKSGVGRALYEGLENILKMQNILNLNACIAYTAVEDEHLTNNSVQFHDHMGYRLVGRFQQCGNKFGRWYDMVWMEKHIGEHKENPEKIKPFTEIREELKNNK